MRDGRRFVPVRTVRARRQDDGTIALIAPCPGLWRGAPPEGARITPGASVGELEVLGVLHRLVVPSDAEGVVTQLPGGRPLARRPVDARTVLAVLDPNLASLGERGGSAAAEVRSHGGGPVFRTPLGGRYYARPSPDAEPFVRAGDVVSAGTTVALIEVMKTFNRVSYGGAGLPERARVEAIVPADGDDVEPGDPLLELEALE